LFAEAVVDSATLTAPDIRRRRWCAKWRAGTLQCAELVTEVSRRFGHPVDDVRRLAGDGPMDSTIALVNPDEMAATYRDRLAAVRRTCNSVPIAWPGRRSTPQYPG